MPKIPKGNFPSIFTRKEALVLAAFVVVFVIAGELLGWDKKTKTDFEKAKDEALGKKPKASKSK